MQCEAYHKVLQDQCPQIAIALYKAPTEEDFQSYLCAGHALAIRRNRELQIYPMNVPVGSTKNQAALIYFGN